MTVADRIRNRRIELGLSQADLAKKAKYSDKTRVSKIENSGDNISMKQIKKIAVALETTPSYLMGWKELPTTATGHGVTMVTVERENSSVKDPAKVEQAMKLYDLYENAPPEIRSAVEAILKAQKPDV